MENEPDNNEEIEMINNTNLNKESSGAEALSSNQALKERFL